MTAGRRDQIASALADWMPAWLPAERRELLDVVDRMIRQAQAEALDEMADDMDAAASTGRGIRRQVVNLVASRLARSLRDRAAALRVTTDRLDVTQDAHGTPSEPP